MFRQEKIEEISIHKLSKAQALLAVISAGIAGLYFALWHKAWEVRLQAVRRLGSELPHTDQILSTALCDECYSVADAAYGQYAKFLLINDSEENRSCCATAFIYALADKDCLIQGKLLQGLSCLGNSAIRALKEALRHPDWRIRATAAEAFLHPGIKPSLAFAELTAASNDFVPQVAVAARKALRPLNDALYSSGSAHKALPF